MRVLITTDTVGGVWTFTQELTAGLLRNGCSVALVSLGGVPSADKRSWCDSLHSTYDEHFLYKAIDVALEWMQSNASAYQLAAPVLLQVAREFGADVLHSNQFCFGALPSAIPRIITAHSDVLSWSKSCHGRLPESSPWLSHYQTLVTNGLRFADAVVAPTCSMLHALQAGFKVPSQTYVIPNGRSINPPGETGRVLRAVTVGRLWDKAKDITLLRTVESPMPLQVAGSLEYDGMLLQIQACGEVKLLGPLAPEQVLELFAQSAIYICTSRYEPFGLAPLEAALCGCAVLARDIPTLREVWSDDALYFSNAATLSRLLHQLAADPSYLHQRQQQSHSRAQRYTAERMTASYLSLYRQLTTNQEAKVHAA